MTQTVLAIGAHPDDMEQFCGGTLLLLKKAGFKVIIVAATRGECGSRTLDAGKIVKIRFKEAQKSAKLLGVDFINLGERDGEVSYDLPTAKKFVRLIREFNPQIIFSHPTDDYMTDHAHTGRLLLWAVPEATHKNFIVDSKDPPIISQPYVYHTDPQGLINSRGQIVPVNTIMDITSVIEEKLKAFSIHASQMDFLKRKQQEINTVEKTRRWAIARGQQVRVLYGEGFTQQLYEQYPRRNILVDILKDKVFTL